MPVILSPSDYDLWLSPDLSDKQRLLDLLAPLSPSEMRVSCPDTPTRDSLFET
jgi:hypothetical protein